MQLSLISLALTRIYGGEAAFDPLSLFASGEQGAWYDPSDFSTMFQDSAGTTPVTADGQPVGLILDKSKGLVLGAEIISNPGPNFTTTTGWSPQGGGTVVVDAGRLKVTQSSTWSDGVLFSLPISTWLSDKYLVEVEIDVGTCTGTGVQVQLGNGIYGNGGIVNGAAFTVSATVTYQTTSNQGGGAGITIKAGDVGYFYINRISMKSRNGNHASQATAAARPLYKTSGGLHWLQFDGVDDSLSTAAIDFTATDKMSVFVGLNKTSAANSHVFYSGTGNYGSVKCFGIQVPLANIGKVSGLLGDASTYSNPIYVHGFTETVSFISTSLFDLAGTTGNEQVKARHNGVPDTIAGHVLLTPGATFSATYPLYVGVGGLGGFPLTGNIYSIIIRGALSTAQEITDTETWVAGKTGISL